MTDKDDNFKTHIKEPRWQQVVSVLVALVLVGIWIWAVWH